MRVLLFTGKGGVGKTSVAAATALEAGRRGVRTLVLSTDPAHSLADAFNVELGPTPTVVSANVDAEQLDAQQRLETNWREIQSYLVALLRWGGVGSVEAEELSVLPGLEEVFALTDVRRHVDAAAHDLLIVDCAPTAETLRLLSLPDALGWYLERVFPLQGALARAVRPVLGNMTDLPMPDDELLAAAGRLHRTLEGVRDVLSDTTRTTIRLVVNPEKLVVAEARRTYTYLSLFGYHVDAVIVNRLLPEAIEDPWFDQWKRVQAAHLETVQEGFAGLPVLTAPLFGDEPVGAAALGQLAASIYGDRDPHGLLAEGAPLRFDAEGDGYLLDIALPFVAKDEIDVLQRGDELYVKVGAHTRSIVLPAALRRCEVAGASLQDGRLAVRFQPVPVSPGLSTDLPR